MPHNIGMPSNVNGTLVLRIHSFKCRIAYQLHNRPDGPLDADSVVAINSN